MTYWEKTVEYWFLSLAIKAGKLDFAAPLAGTLERGAGDAVFAKEMRFILLEFKAAKTGMADEAAKFLDYEEAKKSLMDKDGHHFFVYGELAKKSLNLVAVTYFSSKGPKGDKGSALGCLEDGIAQADFDAYLREFLGYRKRDERSSGSVDVSDYATVIGVDPKNSSAVACSLRDYSTRLNLNNDAAPPSLPNQSSGNNPKPRGTF